MENVELRELGERRVNFLLRKDGRLFPFRIGQTFDGDLFVWLPMDGEFVIGEHRDGPMNFMTLRFARNADDPIAPEENE